MGDFNARMQFWYQNDITAFEGFKIDIANSKLSQIMNEPTHILSNSASCINLIFTSQPNLVMRPGIHLSLHPNCHHQIVFAFYKRLQQTMLNSNLPDKLDALQAKYNFSSNFC